MHSWACFLLGFEGLYGRLLSDVLHGCTNAWRHVGRKFVPATLSWRLNGELLDSSSLALKKKKKGSEPDFKQGSASIDEAYSVGGLVFPV